jgi:hypothetical protein
LLSYNLYAYCSNNPVNYSDPSGHAIGSVFDALSLLWSLADVLAPPMLWYICFFIWK